MEILNQYINGNTLVTIYNDGTKIREYNKDPQPEFPESIDLKITDYCDMGCPYCHESSTKKGKHADVENIMSMLSTLPAGVEIAIGGGNPLSHPQLFKLLMLLKKQGLIANLTVNQGHLKKYYNNLSELIKTNLIYGLGISINTNNYDKVKLLSQQTNNIVFHLIAGIHEIDIIDKLGEFDHCKILILGYKCFGFGNSYYNDTIQKRLLNWQQNIYKYLTKYNLSFDNLAIKQLHIKNLLTDDAWEKYYMGDDGQFSLYIDAIKLEYATTSTSAQRYSTEQINFRKILSKNREYFL